MTYRLKAILLIFMLSSLAVVSNAQTANFSVFNNNTTICVGNFVPFVQNITYNPVDSIRWDFGDGITQLGQITGAPGHQYNVAGTFTVKMIVYSGAVSDTTTKVNYITVNDNPPVSFTVSPTAGCQPLDVQFNFVNPGTVTSNWTWLWTLSSDSVCISGNSTTNINRPNGNPFTHTLTNDGLYDVSLVVTNQFGCTSSSAVNDLIEVYPKPVADFTYVITPDCDATTNVTFTSTSNIACSPNPVFNWDFGDGTSANVFTPTHVHEYLTSGTFVVRLITTDGIGGNGCSDTTFQTITIDADPTLTASASSMSICLGDDVQFLGNSSGNVDTWLWDFGFGNTSTLQNPVHNFGNLGCHPVSLTITIDTCSFSTTLDTCLIVNPVPVGSFSSLESYEVCDQPHTMTFTTTVSGTLSPSYNWNFGDGTTSTQQNPTKTWNYAGIYPISLNVSSPQGCTSVTQVDTVIIDSINVAFTQNTTFGCEPLTVQFTDNSTSLNNITNWLWDFGDGMTSTQQNPSHTYASFGNYAVKLIVTTSQGCTDSLAIPNLISVGTPPNLSFSVTNNTPCTNETISFINNSDPNGVDWTWFNGLNTVFGFTPPDTFFTTAGLYDVWLSAGVNGCYDTLRLNNFINVPLVEADFNTDGDCDVNPFLINFNNTSNTNQVPATYFWDFGTTPTNTSTAENPSFIFPGSNVYDVTLIVTDINGCTDTTTQNVNLLQPLASFGWENDDLPCIAADAIINLTDSSENYDNCSWNIVGVTYIFGTDSTTCPPVIAFDSSGTYTIELVVISDNGCRDTTSKDICITDVTPVGTVDTTNGSGNLNYSPLSYTSGGVLLTGGGAQGCLIQIDPMTGDTTFVDSLGLNPTNCFANYNIYTGCTPLTISLTDSSTAYPDSIVSWFWNFGDGNTSSLQNPTHTYTQSSGEYAYLVTLTVYNSFGVFRTDSVAFVQPTQPTAYFNLSRDTVCADQFIATADSSSGRDLSYYWTFGNGDTSIVQSPAFSYAAEGNYEVCLTVTDRNGCDSTYCDSIVVINPVALFTVDTTYSDCDSLQVLFTNTSLNDVSWRWDFGNGNTSTLESPSVTYSGTGYYDVTLVAISTSGCRDTLAQNNLVRIDGPLITSYGLTPTDSCVSHTVAFNVQGDNVALITIDYGNGQDTTFTTSVLAPIDTTIYYTYETRGVYHPILRVEDALNCERIWLFDSVATTQPVASFTMDTTLGCVPLIVALNGTASEDVFQYQWTAPGAIISGQGTATPSIRYNNQGYYSDVTLIVTDVNNCKDTLSFTDTITAAGIDVGFYADNYTGCFPLTVNFTDTSAVFPDTISTWFWQFVGTDTDTLQNPTYLYDDIANANRRARLRVTSSYGCTDVVQKNILPTIPNASFFSDTLVCTTQLVTFTNQSTGLGLSYSWDFGDNSPASTAVNPTHLYTSEDTFKIILTVTDQNGCIDKDSVERVVVANPLADFAPNKIYISCPPDSVQFTDLSLNASAWNWTIEGTNPGQYNTQNPAVVYTDPGYYDVQLIITSLSGCFDTLRMDSLIRVDGPYGELSAIPKEGCVDLSVDFNAPLNNTAALIFNSDDLPSIVYIAPGDTFNTTHIYTGRGTYQPTIIIQDSLGCQRILTDGNIIVTDPEPVFTISPVTSCLPFTLTTTNTSLDVSSFEWVYSSGTISNPTANTPTFAITDTGYHTIDLIVTDIYGCKDTASHTFLATDVFPAAMSNVTDGCRPLTVQFTDLTTVFPDSIVSWAWNFGGSEGTSTSKNPVHVYQNIGVYTPILIVTNSYGCTKQITLPQIETTFPSVSYTPSLTYACTGQDILFDNHSTGQALTYSWDFDNGTTVTTEDPTYAFPAEGTYNVCLTTTDINGCDSTYCQIITIADPVANFTVDTVYRPCPPATFQFTDLSVNAVSWSWTFGDGGTSTAQSPSHTYLETGIYDVQLIVTTASGCMDTLLKSTYIEVGGPVGNFTFTPKQGCADVTATFTGNVTANTVDLYIWNFGDGGSITNVSNANTNATTHTYTTAGTYYPTLTLQDFTGCQFVATLDSIEVDTLQFDFFANDTLTCEVGNFTFTPFIASSSPIDSVVWNFGGADIMTSNAMMPTIPYSTVGDFDVTLTVYSRHCTKTVTKTQYIKIAPIPNTNFTTVPAQGCNPTTVFFTDATTIFSGNVVSWDWNLGDGTMATTQNTAHSYQTVGTYDVQLITLSEHGCSDTILFADTVTIYPIPNPDFNLDTFACTGQDVFFTNNSTGNNLTYNWNFGDGNTSTLSEPVHQYANEGTFTVCLTVLSSDGCDSTVCKSVTIANPVANFNSNVQYLPCPNDSIVFNNLSANAISWFWTFGDGDSSTLQNPTHTYTATGFYDVQLIVQGASGCFDTLLQTNYIEIGGPVGNFTFTPKQGCADVTATFTGNVTANTVDLYIWNFGDGGSITNVSNANTNTTTHTYTTTGTYYPTLTLQDFTGCQFVATLDSIEVDTLQFDFFANDTLLCEVGSLNFTPYIASSSPIDSVVWNFGGADITTSNAMMPTIPYSTVGDFDVTLTVHSRHCTKTITKTQYIKIAPIPNSNFTTVPAQGCNPTTVFFTDATTIFSGNVVSWDWSFGDGGTATTQNTAHSYQTVGTYDVQLITVSEHGCSDTILFADTVTIYPIPNPDFNLDTFACTGQDVFFTNNSTGNNLTYNWNFGDGNTSTLFEPVHQYANEGTFTVCLTVLSSDGCDSTVCKSVTIANPVAAFNSSVQYLACPNDSIIFNDLSTNAVAWFWTFGDGDSSMLQNPTHTYTATGIYDVQLIVTGLSGCQDTLLQTAYIEIGGPVGNFTFTPNQGCADVTATFTGNVTANTVDFYIWDYGDGTIDTTFTNSTTDNATHIYTTTGTYFPTMTIEDFTGCQFVATLDSIEVDTLQFDFFANDTLTCEVGSFTFTPFIASSSPIDSVVWNFAGADVMTSNAMMPTISYSTVGDFDVELTVYSRHCTKTITKTQYIKIAPIPNPGFATAPTVGCNPTTVFFTDTTNIFSGNVVSWAWNLGDGTLDSTQNPTHSYQTVDTFDVQLITVSEHGCTDSITYANLIIINPIPNPDFNLDVFACTGQDVNFTNLSMGNVLTYNWDFGDGNSSTAFEPIHQYSTEDTFNVCLTVTDINGCDSTICKTVVIANPVAAFTANTQYLACPPDSVQFTDNSINAIAWHWTFGDGDTSILQNPTHTYTTTGFYDVQLIVQGASGCFDTLLQTNYIEVGGPVGNFAFTPKQGCADVTATFVGTITNNSVAQYHWNFGNGDSITHVSNMPIDSFEYVYTSSGTFFPTVTFEDSTGCTFFVELDSIEVDTLQFDFFATDTVFCETANITFNPYIASSSPIDSVLWMFSGATVTTSTLLIPTIPYDTIGDFDVTLTVFSNHCFKTITKTQYIKAAPIPTSYFTTATNPFCSEQTISFLDASTIFSGNIVDWQWDFGDLTASTAQNPTHTYADSGFYNMNLLVTSEYGCTDDTTITVYINKTPDPMMTPAPVLCIGEVFTLTASGGDSYAWYNGLNLVCDTCTSIDVAPILTTNYTLIATSTAGCQNTISQTVSVLPYAIPPLVVSNDTTICKGDVIQLFASGGYDIVQYQWDVNVPGLSCYTNCTNPFASPDVTTTYYVTLTWDGGCSKTDSITVTVIDDAQPILGVDRTICLGESVQLGISTGGNAIWTPGDGLSCVFCDNPVASPLLTTTYAVEVTTPNGCTIRDTMTVNVQTPEMINAGDDVTICLGTAIPLEGQGIGTVTWSPAATLSDSSILTPTASPIVTTDYILTVQNDLCVQTDTVTITVADKVDINIADIEICEGETVAIDVQGYADTYAFTPDSGVINIDPILIQPSQTTTYTVVGSIPSCEADTTTFTITVNPIPDIGLLPSMVVFKNSTTPLPIDYPNSQYLHTWTPSTQLSCPDCFDPFFIADTTFSAMTIYVDLLTQEGCSFTDSIMVTLTESCGTNMVQLPTAFTPNGDGQNDIFRVRALGLSDIEIFRVYNRWGEQLFSTSLINEGWDGTYKGQPVEQGVYHYYVQAICPLTGEILTYKGDVFLHF